MITREDLEKFERQLDEFVVTANKLAEMLSAMTAPTTNHVEDSDESNN